MKARFILASLVALCTAPLVTGCVVESRPASPQQPPMEEVAVDNNAPVQMAAGLGQGRPPRLHEGAPMSYWIWQDGTNSWHVRTTTTKQRHRFQGRIRPLNGSTISNIRATRLEWGDRVRRSGADAVFDFTTQGGADGIDFAMNGNGCLDMDLRIDGIAHPKLTIVGKSEQTPASGHFIVCP